MAGWGVRVPLVLLASVVATLLAVGLSREGAGAEQRLMTNDDGVVPRGAFLQFNCGPVGVKSMDPIAGSSHLHDFRGRVGVGPRTTSSELKRQANKRTTCRSYRAPDENAYWFPLVREEGKVMPRTRATVYITDLFIGGGDLKNQFPPRLEYIGGYPRAPLEWRCMGGSGPQDDTGRLGSLPLGCKGITRFIAHFPNCWNRKPSPGPDDVVFRRGACPKGHTRIPDMRMSVDFRPADGVLSRPVQVTTGHGQWGSPNLFHADSMDGRARADGDGGTTTGFELLLKRCVLDQPTDSTVNGRIIQPPPFCFVHRR